MNIVFLFLWAIIWFLLAFAILKYLEAKKLTESKTKSEKLISDATKEKEEILSKAKNNAEEMTEKTKKEASEMMSEARREASEMQKKAEKLEERFLEKEEKLEKKLEEITEKQEKIIQKEEELEEEKKKIDDKKQELDGKLWEIAKLSEEDAKEIFVKQIWQKYENDALEIVNKHRKIIEEKKKEISRDIIIKSIQQYAWDVTSEVTTTLIELPSDDMKWKLIWKEWRNIVAFERATWVALIIDDAPDTVFISAFDLFRRYIAKKSLEKLIEDWRIQPARIEDVVQKTEEEADILLKELGQQALDELNIANMPDEIIPLIGKLRFRTSYGQNILKHSIEVAFIAESIAKDLWVDSKLVKKWWLLHDLGKALDHDIEWTHPEIWWRVGRKYGLEKEVVDMIENHHGDSFSISIFASIVQIADAISSIRPWARRESIEQYIKRVQEMESLVQSFSGVSKAYAISAGREVRIFVDAHTVSDLEASNMAKDIADEIQDKLNYPGEVKVNLVRELRVIEYAK